MSIRGKTMAGIGTAAVTWLAWASPAHAFGASDQDQRSVTFTRNDQTLTCTVVGRTEYYREPGTHKHIYSATTSVGGGDGNECVDAVLDITAHVEISDSDGVIGEATGYSVATAYVRGEGAVVSSAMPTHITGRHAVTFDCNAQGGCGVFFDTAPK